MSFRLLTKALQQNQARKRTGFSYLLLRSFSQQLERPSFGIAFDIDGVILLGNTPVGGSPEALRRLYNTDGRLKIPYVFLTNGGGYPEAKRASELSQLLSINVSSSQVLQGHSPFRQLVNRYENELIVAVGKGDPAAVMSEYGFKNVLSIDEYASCFDNIDPLAPYKKWTTKLSATQNPKSDVKAPSIDVFSERVQAAFIVSDPVDWSRDIQDRNEVLSLLKDHLIQAQNRVKQQANQHRRAVNYNVGDNVYLKIQPYKLRNLAKRVNQKLSPRYYGPYEILERIGEVAYKLKLPDDSRVHPVFQVSLLKPTVTDEVDVQPLPPYVAEDLELQSIPEEILAVRGKNKEDAEVLVKWTNLPECENSWELVTKMMEHFPELHLEDKVSFEGDGVDEDIVNEGQFGKITKVYERGKWRKVQKGQNEDSPAEGSSTRLYAGN